MNSNNDVKQTNTYASQFACGPTSSRVDFCAQSGVPYLIFIRAVGNVGGDFDLTLVDSGQPCSPTCTLTPPPGAIVLECLGGVPCTLTPVLQPCSTVFGAVGATLAGTSSAIFFYNVPTGDSGYVFRFQSEFPAFVNILREANPADPCQFITVNAGGQFAIPACTQYDITFSGMVAGDRHEIVVTMPIGTLPNCGGPGTHYILRVESTAQSCVTGPDCFTRGPAGPAGPCGTPTQTRPQNAGHYTRGGPNGATDSIECRADWDGDGCILPSDVAAYISTWFFSTQNPGNLDADLDCDGSAAPADVAHFVTTWFGALVSGC